MSSSLGACTACDGMGRGRYGCGGAANAQWGIWPRPSCNVGRGGAVARGSRMHGGGYGMGAVVAMVRLHVPCQRVGVK